MTKADKVRFEMEIPPVLHAMVVLRAATRNQDITEYLKELIVEAIIWDYSDPIDQPDEEEHPNRA